MPPHRRGKPDAWEQRAERFRHEQKRLRQGALVAEQAKWDRAVAAEADRIENTPPEPPKSEAELRLQRLEEQSRPLVPGSWPKLEPFAGLRKEAVRAERKRASTHARWRLPISVNWKRCRQTWLAGKH